jgi:hypothetical protein
MADMEGVARVKEALENDEAQCYQVFYGVMAGLLKLPDLDSSLE